MKLMIKSYSELITLPTWEERLDYLRTNSKIGVDTFGFDRIFNQRFYRSPEWKRLRNEIISRDEGCDLGIFGYEIPDGITINIHHMNPITMEEIDRGDKSIFDPEYLITTTSDTHKLIHYGGEETIKLNRFTERTQNDTCPWNLKGVINE